VSLYYGISAGLQLLSISFLSIALQSSTFANCSVRASAQGGNAYGGAVSLHIGAYSSAYSKTGAAVAAAGDTVVRNVNVTLDTVDFKSCSAIREQKESSSYGANVYGGSFSFHIGAYAWSRSSSGGSSSTCGSTNASGIRVRVQNTTSVNSKSLISGGSYGANSYGGSMSVLHVGAYSWSSSIEASSSNSISTCEATTASDVSVHVSGSGCVNCSAISTSESSSHGANSYGGSMSVLHVGAYSWSRSAAANSISSSTCGAATASNVSVHISGSGCSNCIAISTSGYYSNGANLYGGSMSALHVGAYSWSFSVAANGNSISTIEATTASDVSVYISGSGCSNCSAISTSGYYSNGANSYGGSMSALHVGAYSWSFSVASSSSSTCGATTASDVSVHVSGTGCSNCSAISTSGIFSYGANSYGGSMSVLHVGAYSWSNSPVVGDSSSSACGSTNASGIRVRVQNTTSVDSRALTTTSVSVSYGANSYGGSMSVLHVGAYSWSSSIEASSSNSISTCEATTASDVSVHVSGSGCVNCSAISTSGYTSYGANSYGGALSAAFIGSYSYSSVGSFFFSSAIIGSTEVVRLSVTIQDSTIVDAVAASGEHCRTRSIPT
jgi:hypothetical protein